MKKSGGRDKCFALGTLFLTKWDSVHFGGNVIKLPMIGSPRSTCMNPQV